MINLKYIPRTRLNVRRLQAENFSVDFAQKPAIALAGGKKVVVEINHNYGVNEWVTGETPTGAVNGSNATFQTAFDFVPETVEVFIETARLSLLDDYNTAGNRTVNFYVSPLTGEKIRVNYKKA